MSDEQGDLIDVTTPASPRGGAVFDEVADAYERHRPVYPEALIDRACEVAGLRPGAAVLEVGCGTGQLTRSLLQRDLRVVAIEPGKHLLARARTQLRGIGDAQFIHASLEAASLPGKSFAAIFSASAIHWVDPEVGWRKLAAALRPGGTLALISYFGRSDPDTADDQPALRDALERVAPALAAEWPVDRTLEAMQAGVLARRGNIAEAWAWLGSYAVGRAHVAQLFSDVRFDALPIVVEHSAEQITALLGTMSFWARLSRGERIALATENDALQQRLGRPIRSSIAACLLTARSAALAEGARVTG